MNLPQQQLQNDIMNFRSLHRINKFNKTYENEHDDSIEKLQKEYKDFLLSERRNQSQQQYTQPQDQPLDRSEKNRNYSTSNNSRIQLKNLMRSEPASEGARQSYENSSPLRNNNHILQNNFPPTYGFNPELNSYRAPSRSSSYNQESQSIGNSMGINQYSQEMYSPLKSYSQLQSTYASKLQQLEKQMFAQPYQYSNYQPPLPESESYQEYKQNTVPIVIEKPIFIEKKIYIEKPVYIEKEIEIPVYKPIYKEVRQEIHIQPPQSERAILNRVDSSHSVLQQSINRSPQKRQKTIEKASPPQINHQQQYQKDPSQTERAKNLPIIQPAVLKKAKFEGLGFIFEAIKPSLQKILSSNVNLCIALKENQNSSQQNNNVTLMDIVNSIKRFCLELMGDLHQNILSQSFTPNLKQFIQIYTMEEVVPCQEFHLLFEIKRFQFNRQNNIVGKSYQRDCLIISTFFIIRVVINQLLLRYKKFNLSFRENQFSFNNAKLIGSVIYHLIRHNLQYNNPNFSHQVETSYSQKMSQKKLLRKYLLFMEKIK